MRTSCCTWPCHDSRGQSLASRRGKPGSIPGQFMWDLWSSERQWNGLLSEFSSISIISPLGYSILIFIYAFFCSYCKFSNEETLTNFQKIGSLEMAGRLHTISSLDMYIYYKDFHIILVPSSSMGFIKVKNRTHLLPNICSRRQKNPDGTLFTRNFITAYLVGFIQLRCSCGLPTNNYWRPFGALELQDNWQASVTAHSLVASDAGGTADN
jgi:hypothetical protein